MPERERIDDRVRDHAVRAVADAAQQRARRHAGCGDEDVVARDEVVGGQHPLGIEARVDELLALLVVPRPELPLDPAADALERRGGDHAFGRPADPVSMSTPVPPCAAAIAGATSPSRMRLHLRARLAQLGDQLLVPVALEHDDARPRAA